MQYYKVKYIWNVDNSNHTSWKMTEKESDKYIKKLKRENKLSANNSKILRGKSFILYKNIRRVKA